MAPEKLVYHSTDKAGLEAAQKDKRLFGMERLNPRSGYSGESNLTPDKNASQRFIREFRGNGSWTKSDGPPRLVTLTFTIPEEFLKEVGEYATTMTVDVGDLPEQYLHNLHAGTGMVHMTREEACLFQAQGKVRFYEVPLDFLQSVEPVQFTWRGIKYP